MEVIKEWAGLVGSILATGGVVYTWLTARASGNSVRLDKLEAVMADQDKALTRLENEMKHLPTKDMVANLDVQITHLSGSIDTLAATMTGIGKTVDLMDQYLRKEGR